MYVIISHRKDLDGLSSAALVLRYAAKHRRAPFVLSLKDYTDEDAVVEEKFLDLQNSNFIITDLSTNLPKIESILEKLRTVKSWNNYVRWFDHHPTTDGARAALAAVVDHLDLRDSATVASEITYDDLFVREGISDAHAELLSQLGRDSDLLELKMAITPKLMDMVDYLNYLDKDTILHPRLQSMVLQLAFPRIEADQDGLIEAHQDGLLEEYERLKTKAKHQILADSEVFKAGRYTVVLFSYPPIFSGTQASMVVLDQHKADLSIGLSSSGEGSVRRGSSEISCRKIAELFGGGGHDFAAGFPTGRRQMSAKELAEYRRRIREAVVRYLS
jgi:oligoribonuclease NrnB/cAMP/cGMP phosphodiesterase (DHH superfamily)